MAAGKRASAGGESSSKPREPAKWCEKQQKSLKKIVPYFSNKSPRLYGNSGCIIDALMTVQCGVVPWSRQLNIVCSVLEMQTSSHQVSQLNTCSRMTGTPSATWTCLYLLVMVL